jgi:hypothetical protein
MKKADRDTLAGFCWANRDEFYRECPAMGVEHFVCEARTRDPNRPPSESDAIDLQHTVLGLSYCDVLVTERYMPTAWPLTRSGRSRRCRSQRFTGEVYISGSPAASGQPLPAKALIDFLAAPFRCTGLQGKWNGMEPGQPPTTRG